MWYCAYANHICRKYKREKTVYRTETETIPNVLDIPFNCRRSVSNMKPSWFSSATTQCVCCTTFGQANFAAFHSELCVPLAMFTVNVWAHICANALGNTIPTMARACQEQIAHTDTHNTAKHSHPVHEMLKIFPFVNERHTNNIAEYILASS